MVNDHESIVSERSELLPQQVPLSNFKLFPIHNCSAFEQCLTTITSRKLLRNILPDGSLGPILCFNMSLTFRLGTPDDDAFPGYFSTNLSNSIRVELTATRRTALHRYTFPVDSVTPRILLDVTNDGQSSANDITMLIDPKSGRMTGVSRHVVQGYFSLRLQRVVALLIHLVSTGITPMHV